mgnify:CR=1 FL=1
MSQVAAVEIEGLTHHYGTRRALSDLALLIRPGEMFALLGPNGSGKSTLFRVLSTLIAPEQGSVQICGHDVRRDTDVVRQAIGVVFQSPSLDDKLSVAENLIHQGHLYGLFGAMLRERVELMLDKFGVGDRRRDRVATLSGGLRRRVELAKGILHLPQILLLDEPSTGLDPAARADLWKYLKHLRDESDTTIIWTTHLLDEADDADRIAILNQGSLVAFGAPHDLRAEIGSDAITIHTADQARVAERLRSQLSMEPQRIDSGLRLLTDDGRHRLSEVAQACGDDLRGLSWGRATLEDVFIQRTGHRFDAPQAEASP